MPVDVVNQFLDDGDGLVAQGWPAKACEAVRAGLSATLEAELAGLSDDEVRDVDAADAGAQTFPLVVVAQLVGAAGRMTPAEIGGGLPLARFTLLAYATLVWLREARVRGWAERLPAESVSATIARHWANSDRVRCMRNAFAHADIEVVDPGHRLLFRGCNEALPLKYLTGESLVVAVTAICVLGRIVADDGR